MLRSNNTFVPDVVFGCTDVECLASSISNIALALFLCSSVILYGRGSFISYYRLYNQNQRDIWETTAVIPVHAIESSCRRLIGQFRSMR